MIDKSKIEQKADSVIHSFNVAGVSFRPDAVQTVFREWKLNIEKHHATRRMLCWLEPDPANKFDSNAIKVWVRLNDNLDLHVGYVPKGPIQATFLREMEQQEDWCLWGRVISIGRTDPDMMGDRHMGIVVEFVLPS